jgi:hypothetical protein
MEIAMQSYTRKTLACFTYCRMVGVTLLLLSGCSPTIDNLAPSVGYPGNKILITGTNLTTGGSNPLTVDFNGVMANFQPVGNDVEATVPQGATTGPVHVTTSYVSSYYPGGTAVSPFDFTVISSAFLEQESNNTRATANNAYLAQAINGSTTDTDTDWFRINSGSFGPWGYGIEIVAEPTNLPVGVSLRVVIEGYRSDLNAIGHLVTYDDNKPFTLWTTHAPGTDIFLNVYWVGSTSQSFTADYTLKISRIAITDTNEADDSFGAAKEIAMVNGIGHHETSYLCNIFKGGEDVGMKDFYFFDPNGATQIGIVVGTPPLDASDGVYVHLYDSTQMHRGGAQGTNIGANYNLTLTGGETATGQWYIEVTNAWNHYVTNGAGPSDKMPLSCKAPYAITVTAN